MSTKKNAKTKTTTAANIAETAIAAETTPGPIPAASEQAATAPAKTAKPKVEKKPKVKAEAPVAQIAPMPAPQPEAAPEAKPEAEAAPVAKENRKGREKKEKTEKLSALDAAAKVLASATEPMTTKELIGVMALKGLWSSPGGKTPDATLYAAILREINTKGDQARFNKVAAGRFALAARP